tara:strand:- start:1326 stop:1772 length:447 start_codon:yes stop_codon:yes gene_type:complete
MSTIVTDTLQGKTSATSINLPTTTNIGSTPLVSASANSMTIRGEGSNTTSIQQGLAKAWVEIGGTGTVALNDSFNHSGVIDEATGNYALAFTTAMGNTTYSIQTHDSMWGRGWSDSDGTGGFDTRRVTKDNVYLDIANVWATVHGDLA